MPHPYDHACDTPSAWGCDVADLERKLTRVYQQLSEKDKQIAALKVQLRKDLPYDAMGDYSA